MNEADREDLREDLKFFEGTKNTIEGPDGREHSVYLDSRGIPTIGFGANLTEAYNQQLLEQLGYDPQAVLNGTQTISEQAANLLLEHAMDVAIQDAPTFVDNFDSLDPHAQLAVTEMSFNMGHGALNGDDGKHDGFPSLREDLSHEDYAAAAGEVHTEGIADSRNAHLWSLMEQANQEIQLPVVDLSAELSSPSLADQLSLPDIWATTSPFDHPTEAQAQSAPLSNLSFPLPMLLQDTDFGTGAAPSTPVSDHSSLQDSSVFADQGVAGQSSGGFLSGVQDFMSSLGDSISNVVDDATNVVSVHTGLEQPHPSNIFEQAVSIFSPPSDTHTETAYALNEPSSIWSAPPVYEDSSASNHGFLDSIFSGGTSTTSDPSPSYDFSSSHSTDSFSSHDSGSSHHDSGADSHDAGSHDADVGI